MGGAKPFACRDPSEYLGMTQVDTAVTNRQSAARTDRTSVHYGDGRSLADRGVLAFHDRTRPSRAAGGGGRADESAAAARAVPGDLSEPRRRPNLHIPRAPDRRRVQ